MIYAYSDGWYDIIDLIPEPPSWIWRVDFSVYADADDGDNTDSKFYVFFPSCGRAFEIEEY